MKHQTFEEFFNSFCKQQTVNEDWLQNAAIASTLGAAMLGGINNADGKTLDNNQLIVKHTTQQNTASPMALSQFAVYWAKYYNAEENDKTNWAKKELVTRTSLPTPRLQQSITKAAKCFDGDAGLDFNTIIKLLTYTGRLESNYSASNLQSSSGAVGYWQVLPSTAHDRLTKGAAYFGKNFEAQFGKGKLLQYQKLSFKQLRYKLKTDSDFCALIAAAKWVTIAQQINNKQNHILNNIFKN